MSKLMAANDLQFRRPILQVAQEVERDHILEAKTQQDNNPPRQCLQFPNTFLPSPFAFLSFDFDARHFPFQDEAHYSLKLW